MNTNDDPDTTYFFNATSGAPLDEWDFEETWYTRPSDYPKLKPYTHTIHATAGSHGHIAPSGYIDVPHGNDQAFTITPNSGYEIHNVVIDGSSVGDVATYTFHDVIDEHTIHASFAAVSSGGHDPDVDDTDDSDTTSGRGVSTSSGASSEDAEETRILLNDFFDFFGNGVELDLTVGQVVYFMIGEEEHTATIKEIGTDYVILVLASAPQEITLSVGQTGQYDVTEDAQNDIEIGVKKIEGDTARLKFKQLIESIIPNTPEPTSAGQLPTAAPRAGATTNWTLMLAGAAGIAAVMVIIIIGIRRRKEKKYE